jgi:uncharacterized protein (DUF1684 family)
MKRLTLILLSLLISGLAFSQKKTYKDSIQDFITDYVETHGVVKGDDKKSLQFYPIDEKFRFNCRFEKTENSPWFMMETSGLVKKSHRVYGKVHFTLNDTVLTLCVYQSQDLMKVNQLKDYLFIPFMDATTGEETYESGRYFDFSINDIKENRLVVDFNKAYNPYCAYTADYNCPVPPKENRINVAILAGEKKYLKSAH